MAENYGKYVTPDLRAKLATANRDPDMISKMVAYLVSRECQVSGEAFSVCYGRFARVVSLSAPCDTSQATASMNNGELRISVPRRAERRGRSIRIAIPGEPPTT